jgi:pimeloyl-ACP methyl ester carboxylesterase
MEATLSDFADALLALEAHMGSPAAVVAHSFGTLATLLAVRRGLSARSLVLIAVPSPRERLDMFRNVLGLSDASLRAVKRIIQTRVGMSWDDVEGPALAAGIVVPSLVLHDRSDRAAPMEISERTAAALASATFRVTEGLGHRRILKDPGVVAETVSFVAAHANRASSSRARVARWKPCGDGRPSQRRQLPLFAGALR